jgi:hypothetical protein
MSLMDAQKAYEKMLQDPKNRVSTQGKIKQPTPYSDGIAKDPDGTRLEEDSNVLTAEEQATMDAIDQRMARRQQGDGVIRVEGGPVSESRFEKLEKDNRKMKKQISEIQELMMDMMKAHMKLMEKK